MILSMKFLNYICHFHWCSELLDPTFLFAIDAGEKFSFQPMKFNSLLKITRVKVRIHIYALYCIFWKLPHFWYPSIVCICTIWSLVTSFKLPKLSSLCVGNLFSFLSLVFDVHCKKICCDSIYLVRPALRLNFFFLKISTLSISRCKM